MNASTIGISALIAGQQGLAIAGQNITNATTPGYRRQSVNLGSRETAGVGTGVDVVSITRYDSPPLRAAILRGNSDEAAAATQRDVQQQVETTLGQSPNDVSSRTEDLFNKLEALSAKPADAALRRDFVASAGQLATQFNTVAGDLSRLKSNVSDQAFQQVDQVNTLTTKIADLNGRIYNTDVAGGNTNDLRDQRDQAVDDLSKLVDFRTTQQDHGVVTLTNGSTTLVVGSVPTKFTAIKNGSDQFEIHAGTSTTPVSFTGGSLGGLTNQYNVDLPATRGRLDALAGQIAQQLNQAQATGLGTAGPFSTVVGTQGVSDPTAPLATQNLPFPISNGQLTISLTNASGTRTNSNIAIDPTTQSLNDVAAAITAGTGGQVTASVDTPSNVLRFQAAAGVQFDFAGRVPTTPPTNTLAGTSTPTLDGAYNGTANENFTFNVVGSGTVGTTPGLQLEIRNAANNVVGTLDVGDKYTPGTALAVGNGLSVKLSAGTLTGGSFGTPANGTPDTANVLSGLGVNGIFSGSTAGTLTVNPKLTADPGLLATSRNGQPADTSNLQRLTALRTAGTAAGGRSFTAEATDIASTVGSRINSLDGQQATHAGVVQNLFAQEQSVTGVDTNEEVVKLLDYQRLIQTAAKYIGAVNDAMDSIIQIVR
ncbi:flagellar hook-associated protein FlgK [Limnoglobus roseus]|uniref:Flagellar hook-associated protein 1 n=1 Tax=Limnoglobus roseus TaxID=2598579 RepID=A0A5C1A716_9BACT|nr:flagellar hook-associated protein FlgK [Limnoglobus roseus]QEL13796.1 flagellar hook-associated protein FlgK [Limnoglobus roseus]